MMKVQYLLGSLLILLIVACQDEATKTPPVVQYTKVSGKTMGTTYNVTYDDPVNYKAAIDSVLLVVNNEVSTYVPTSTISTFNQSTGAMMLTSPTAKTHFTNNFEAAKKIFELSKGAFDPTVMPIVNYWGFGYTPKRKITEVDTLEIQKRLAAVGMEKVRLQSNTLTKLFPEVQLDFSALAKGYGVDQIGLLLESKGIKDYMVEIGGEVRARGKNHKVQVWNMGINTPEETAKVTDLFAAIRIDNRSIATSGNYRNFYEVDGMKYSHTINPKTGFPERNALLSASVLTTDCMTADALATTCMVLGLEGAKALIKQLPNTDAYFIYGAEDGSRKVWMTDDIKALVTKL